jgi:hypothetical protein
MSDQLNIQFAIQLYNASRDKSTPKMTMIRLAHEVYPNLSPMSSLGKISALNTGRVENQGIIRISDIRRICEVLQCDVKVLFNQSTK